MLVTAPLPASALLTPRQYWRFAALTSLAVSLLATPSILLRPGATAGYFMVQVGRIVVFSAEMFGLNYYLRYGSRHSPHRRPLPPTGRTNALHTGVNLVIATLTSVLLRAAVAGLGYPDAEPWANTLLGALVFGGIMLAVQVFISLLERAQHLARENEQFKLVQLQARYESLRQQLSPHFLFNSLATLRGLLYEDLAAAERFVEEMAHVYRYLLHHSAQPAVPLEEELSFLQSYVFLLQMRFGEGFVLHVDIPAYALPRLVPPLALQMLVENVLKHNVIGRQQPMHLYIELRTPDHLQVRNACSPRLHAEPSSGIGLHNLADRVRLLHHAELLVEQDTEFRVSLPLPA